MDPTGRFSGVSRIAVSRPGGRDTLSCSNGESPETITLPLLQRVARTKERQTRFRSAKIASLSSPDSPVVGI